MEDNEVLNHVKRLVDEEEHLYSKPNLTDCIATGVVANS